MEPFSRDTFSLGTHLRLSWKHIFSVRLGQPTTLLSLISRLSLYHVPGGMRDSKGGVRTFSSEFSSASQEPDRQDEYMNTTHGGSLPFFKTAAGPFTPIAVVSQSLPRADQKQRRDLGCIYHPQPNPKSNPCKTSTGGGGHTHHLHCSTR